MSVRTWAAKPNVQLAQKPTHVPMNQYSALWKTRPSFVQLFGGPNEHGILISVVFTQVLCLSFVFLKLQHHRTYEQRRFSVFLPKKGGREEISSPMSAKMR